MPLSLNIRWTDQNVLPTHTRCGVRSLKGWKPTEASFEEYGEHVSERATKLGDIKNANPEEDGAAYVGALVESMIEGAEKVPHSTASSRKCEKMRKLEDMKALENKLKNEVDIIEKKKLRNQLQK